MQADNEPAAANSTTTTALLNSQDWVDNVTSENNISFDAEPQKSDHIQDATTSSCNVQQTPESNVIIKQEISNDFIDTDNTQQQSSENSKQIKTEVKDEEPVKSSMEILSELFSTFDAEPPVIVKKEKSEHKKHKKDKKKHKHKKKKEKKRKRGDSESDEESLAKVVIKSELSSPKRIKIERDEAKVKNEEDTNSKNSKIVIKDLKFSSIFEATIREIKEKQEKDKSDVSRSDEEKSRQRRKKHKHHRSEDLEKSRERRRSRERARSRSRGRKSDDDYDTWLRSREKDHHHRRDHNKYTSDREKHRTEKDKRKSSSKYDSERRSKDRERHRRERSTSKDSSSYIDKKRLLEIARRNAIQMMKSGSLPGALTLGPQAQEKVIAAIKAGGKTVEELTDFCKTLSQKEALGELSSVSEESDSDTEKGFHHPFQIKDRPTSITMNIKVYTLSFIYMCLFNFLLRYFIICLFSITYYSMHTTQSIFTAVVPPKIYFITIIILFDFLLNSSINFIQVFGKNLTSAMTSKKLSSSKRE